MSTTFFWSNVFFVLSVQKAEISQFLVIFSAATDEQNAQGKSAPGSVASSST